MLHVNKKAEIQIIAGVDEDGDGHRLEAYVRDRIVERGAGARDLDQSR